MLNALDTYLTKKYPFLKSKKLLIAISGGVDSVVLTHLLNKLGYTIALAHCNFKLRGADSDLDEQFVKQLGNTLNINTFTTTLKLNTKKSIQLEARTLRYQWFADLQQKHHFDYVLTAHHANDNLETFIINLARGTGLDGLTGIPENNARILRPLLPFSRAQISNYAKVQNINWREDKSNASTNYVRNTIRHHIMPVLETINPNIIDSFKKTIAYTSASADFIKTVVNNTFNSFSNTKDGIIYIKTKPLQALDHVEMYIHTYFKTYGFMAFKDIFKLLKAQSGKAIHSATHTLLKDRDQLLLYNTAVLETTFNKEYTITKNTTELKVPLHLKLEHCKAINAATINTIYLNNSAIKYPLTIRTWQNGDYFYPKGMQGKKKLSKFFKDKKLSLLEKNTTWLLCDNTNTILWVIGKRQSKFCLAKADTDILKITLKN